jgi:hypothetical protein
MATKNAENSEKPQPGVASSDLLARHHCWNCEEWEPVINTLINDASRIMRGLVRLSTTKMHLFPPGAVDCLYS